MSYPDIPDYKWFCFNGVSMFCQVIQDRTKHETIDFFDTQRNHQQFVGLTPFVKNAKSAPRQPSYLDIHINVARALSKGIPFSRIDLYDVKGRIIFGEITFYPNSGMG